MRVVFLGLLLSTATAFTPSFGLSRSTTSLDATRKEFIQTAFIGAASTFFVPPSFAGETVTLPSGVSYVIDKAGTGPLPDRGELAAIRFRAFAGEIKIDDIFDTPEPYYTRVGSGGMLKGVEEVIPQMRVGDRWTLTIPSDLAFGSKGRPSSAGKPRIPAGTTVIFEVEMVGLPGKEPELIDLIGDE